MPFAILIDAPQQKGYISRAIATIPKATFLSLPTMEKYVREGV